MLLRTLNDVEALTQRGRRGKSVLQQRKMKAAATTSAKEDARRGGGEGKEKEEHGQVEVGSRSKEENETKEREAGMMEEPEAEVERTLVVGATAGAIVADEWTCSLCTLINGALERHCTLCGTLREMKEGCMVEDDSNRRKARRVSPCSCEGKAEHQVDVAVQLEDLKEKNEQLLGLLMKMKEEAKRSKEEKERFSSYESLMLAASSFVVTDKELADVEADLEAKLALVRRVRRDHADVRAQELERELRDTRAATLCIICVDSPRTVTFAPCGHFISCLDCCETTDTCPLCRKWISLRLKTFKN